MHQATSIPNTRQIMAVWMNMRVSNGMVICLFALESTSA